MHCETCLRIREAVVVLSRRNSQQRRSPPSSSSSPTVAARSSTVCATMASICTKQSVAFRSGLGTVVVSAEYL